MSALGCPGEANVIFSFFMRYASSEDDALIKVGLIQRVLNFIHEDVNWCLLVCLERLVHAFLQPTEKYYRFLSSLTHLSEPFIGITIDSAIKYFDIIICISGYWSFSHAIVDVVLLVGVLVALGTDWSASNTVVLALVLAAISRTVRHSSVLWILHRIGVIRRLISSMRLWNHVSSIIWIRRITINRVGRRHRWCRIRIVNIFIS